MDASTASQHPSRYTVAHRERALADAELVLRVHVPDGAGGCVGCREAFGRWMPYTDCHQANWARRVTETHAATGVASRTGGHVGVATQYQRRQTPGSGP
jgi:hypothetical protein